MVMLMTCWSLESKIDSFTLKPVEYLTEISIMPEFHPDLLITLAIVRAVKYLPFQPCSKEWSAPVLPALESSWGSVKDLWARMLKAMAKTHSKETELAYKIQRQKREALKLYEVFGQRCNKPRKYFMGAGEPNRLMRKPKLALLKYRCLQIGSWHNFRGRSCSKKDKTRMWQM